MQKHPRMQACGLPLHPSTLLEYMATKGIHNIITVPGSSDVEVKKSHFLCTLKNVRSEDEARAFIEEVRKTHYDARHNCFAMRIGTPDKVFERSSDDGEPQGTAGKPMLDILKGAELYDVCAVVTRYFGGMLLGTGGLVRAYSDSLKEGLAASEIAELTKGAVLKITADYGLAEKVKRMAVTEGACTLNEEYGAECTLTYLVRQDAEQSFNARLTAVSNGQLEAVKEREVLFAGGTRPVLYD